MPKPTKQQVQDQLTEAEKTIDEIAGLIADPELSETEKLEAIEDLVFDDEEEAEEEEV